MAQQFLHAAQVAAALQDVGGKGMAQGMGRGLVGQAQAAAQALHQALRLARAHRQAPPRQEQRRRRRTAERNLRRILVQRRGDQGQHRQAAFLGALADHRQGFAQGHVAALQAQGFGNAQARAIEQGQQGGVARAHPFDLVFTGLSDRAPGIFH